VVLDGDLELALDAGAGHAARIPIPPLSAKARARGGIGAASPAALW